MIHTFVSILTNGNPGQLPQVALALSLTLIAIYKLNGRAWALLYLAVIPFLNWSFGIIESVTLVDPNATFPKGVALHPLTMVTGFVFVMRDFVQRRMGHRVLVVMALAIAWSFYYAWPVIAIVSGLAFAISEAADWMVYTFTKYRHAHPVVECAGVSDRYDDLPLRGRPGAPVQSGDQGRCWHDAAPGELDRLCGGQDGRGSYRVPAHAPA